MLKIVIEGFQYRHLIIIFQNYCSPLRSDYVRNSQFRIYYAFYLLNEELSVQQLEYIPYQEVYLL